MHSGRTFHAIISFAVIILCYSYIFVYNLVRGKADIYLFNLIMIPNRNRSPLTSVTPVPVPAYSHDIAFEL